MKKDTLPSCQSIFFCLCFRLCMEEDFAILLLPPVELAALSGGCGMALKNQPCMPIKWAEEPNVLPKKDPAL